MQTRKCDTAVVIEPNHDPAALWIDSSMIGRSDAITMTAACDDEKRLERTGMQMLAHVGNHTFGKLSDVPYGRN